MRKQKRNKFNGEDPDIFHLGYTPQDERDFKNGPQTRVDRENKNSLLKVVNTSSMPQICMSSPRLFLNLQSADKSTLQDKKQPLSHRSAIIPDNDEVPRSKQLMSARQMHKNNAFHNGPHQNDDQMNDVAEISQKTSEGKGHCVNNNSNQRMISSDESRKSRVHHRYIPPRQPDVQMNQQTSSRLDKSIFSQTGHSFIADQSDDYDASKIPSSGTGGLFDDQPKRKQLHPGITLPRQSSKTIEKLKVSPYARAHQLAHQTTSRLGKNVNQSVGILRHFIAIKYKTKIEVEGLGQYEIEVTNVVNTRTFKERQLMPSLMNMANIQKIQANRCKRIMLEKGSLQLSGGPNRKQLLGRAQPVSLPNKKEEGCKMLERILKRRLRRNFDQLQIGSIDYKRQLMHKRQRQHFCKQRALTLLANVSRMHDVVTKTKVLFQWRELTKEITAGNSQSSSTNACSKITLTDREETLGHVKNFQDRYCKASPNNSNAQSSLNQSARDSKLRKRRKTALNYMDQMMLQRLSDYFTCWKLKVLLGQEINNYGSPSQRQYAENAHRNADNRNQEEELQLDFSTWHKEIEADEIARKIQNPLRSHVRVQQVTSEAKDGADSEEVKDRLENYTFDLSLNDSMVNLGDTNLFSSGHYSQAEQQSVDQVDDLLEDLRGLVCLRQDTVSSRMIEESDTISPYNPDKVSNLTDSRDNINDLEPVQLDIQFQSIQVGPEHQIQRANSSPHPSINN